MKPFKMSIKKGFFTFSVLLLFTGCHKKEDKPTVQAPVKVTVVKVGSHTSLSENGFSRIVSSSNNSTVSFTVSGTITELYASEGQKVSKGQVLGKVKNGDYLNAYNIADAQLEEAQDAYNRLKKLHDANALPEIKWVEIQQKLKQAQNSVELAKRTLDDATLHSPVSGTVTKKYADVGQTVMPVEPVYEITSLQDLTINISVGENEIGSFKGGQKAGVVIPSLSDSVMDGKIVEKAVVADPLTGWWSGTYAIKRKNLELINAQNEMQDLSERLQIEMQDKWNNLTAAHRKMEIEKEGIEQSKENLYLNKMYYEAGMCTLSDLLEAETSFKESEDRYVAAFGEMKTALASYLIATGI